MADQEEKAQEELNPRKKEQKAPYKNEAWQHDNSLDKRVRRKVKGARSLWIYLLYKEGEKKRQNTTKKMGTHGSSSYYLKIMRALDKRRLG